MSRPENTPQHCIKRFLIHFPLKQVNSLTFHLLLNRYGHVYCIWSIPEYSYSYLKKKKKTLQLSSFIPVSNRDFIEGIPVIPLNFSVEYNKTTVFFK
jgi:hypothetical protein